MSKKGRRVSVGKTFVESISVFGLTASMAPLGLQMYAADFLAAAKAVQPPSVPFAPARPYLVCHALELALKAFLSLKGYSLDTLAEARFSHRLANLLDEAELKGLPEFVGLEEDEKFQIRRASVYYSSKVLEYPAIGEALRGLPERPDANILIDAAEKLVSALQEPVLIHANTGR
jgi:hypothetical protein